MYYSGNRELNEDEMKTNALYICDFLLAAGWSKNAIAGVLGNLQTESTLNPAVWQDLDEGNTSKGFGLVQWTPATNYLNWCRLPNATALSTPALPATNIALTNPFSFSVHVYIYGGTVSQVKKNGTTKSLINGLITLDQNDTITVVYSGTPSPSWSWFECMVNNLKRILYEVENGLQWGNDSLGNPPPYTFEHFTHSTEDAYTLGMNFLRYYERPLVYYQPIRGTQAETWFTFLGGIKPKKKSKPWLYVNKRRRFLIT